MALPAIAPRTWLLAAALLAAAAASLGFAHARHPSSAADTRAITRTVSRYETALMAGDGKTACAQLSDRARRDLLDGAAAAGLGRSCQEVATSTHTYVESLIAQAPSPTRAAEARRMIEHPAVEVVALDGDRATARIAEVERHPIPLERSGDGWRIARLPSPTTRTE